MHPPSKEENGTTVLGLRIFQSGTIAAFVSFIGSPVFVSFGDTSSSKRSKKGQTLRLIGKETGSEKLSCDFPAAALFFLPPGAVMKERRDGDAG